MIQVAIDTLVIGSPPAPSAIVLRPIHEREAKGRVLPIWIGPSESLSIGMALRGEGCTRPMTHDLIGSVLDIFGGELEYVVINNVVGTTFYATIVLGQGGESRNIDARPSDAVALAVRNRVPIYVEANVLDVAAFPAVFNPAISRKIENEAFHDFIEKVNPEDFRSRS